VCGDRHEVRECTKACALDVVIQALEFEPVGPQNQWVDVMFLTAIQADIEWRHMHALAAALHVDALNKHSKFIGITIKSEAETYANAVSEPLKTAIQALSSCTANELNNDKNNSITVYQHDVTSFATADSEFDEVESFACVHFHLPANDIIAD